MRTVEKMTIEELRGEKSRHEEILSELRAEYKKINTKISYHYNRLKKIDEELDKLTLDENDIEKLLEKFPETKAKRELREKFLKKFYLSTSGYLPDTNQSCIRIELYKNNDEITDKTFEGITQLLPIIKPIKNGNKFFDIFESTCDSEGIYYLMLTPKNEWKLQQDIYHRTYSVFSDKDLYKVLKYIQKNHYYEKNY